MAGDYYQLLGVERGASDAEIKRAFRKVARELHPDVNAHDPDTEEKFKAAAEAYEVLSDPEQRQIYDRYAKMACDRAVSRLAVPVSARSRTCWALSSAAPSASRCGAGRCAART